MTVGALLALALACSREARAERVEINATRLTVRAGPSKRHKRIGSVPKGRVFEVLKRKGAWVAIQHGSREGWVFGRFVRGVTGRKPTADNKPTPASGTHTVTATRLNVRTTTSVKSKIRFRLLRGAKVTVKETKGTWKRIAHRGKSGWVMGKFLTTGSLPPPRRRVRKRRPRAPMKPRKASRKTTR